jgi:hypothetical protein
VTVADIHTFVRRPIAPLRDRVRFAWARWGGVSVITIWTLLVVIATVQRGVLSQEHTTWPIFRQSYSHLLAGTDLYLYYPTEQGTGPADLFKYSPTWAFLYGAFSPLPFALGLLLWNALNAAVLFAAVRALLPKPQATLALLIMSPWLLHAVQSSSSNALVAGLIVMAYLAMERRNLWGAAFSIAAGALIKIFPLAAVSFALFRPGKVRFALALAVMFVLLIALPLTVVSTDSLLFQYANWKRMVTLDENDLVFGRSVLGLMRNMSGVPLPNWPAQMLGSALLLVPPLLRSDRWNDAAFRMRFLSSLLVFAVIFNHQAEHQSYIIAATGVAFWFVTSERKEFWRVAVLIGCLVGYEAVPYTIAWLAMMVELLTAAPRPVRERRKDRPTERQGERGDAIPEPIAA